MKKQYVLGFYHDDFSVVMICKQRPDWQRGKLNGVGGKIEPGELPAEAMFREFKEETGLQVPMQDWKYFAEMYDDTFSVHCYIAKGNQVYCCRTQTDELVVICELEELDSLTAIDNIPWLVRMGLAYEKFHPAFLRIQYVRP